MATYEEMLKDARWLKKRERILQLRNRKCQKCQKAEKEITLTIHHGYYAPKNEPWNYDDDTLWVLCWPCHKQAQRVLVSVHKTLARLFPFDLEVIGQKVTDGAFEWIHGISEQELEEVLAEERAAFQGQYADYTLRINSSSDIGPSLSDEMEAEVCSVFPGINVDISENDHSPDCVASSVGPDLEICRNIDHWAARWIA